MSGNEDSPLFKSNELVVSDCRQRLEAWAEAEVASELPCERQVRIGKAHREILATAAEQQADVILVAEQPKNWLERFILGSVTRKVKRPASCWVLTIANASEQGTRSVAVKFAPETAWRSRLSDAIKPRARATANGTWASSADKSGPLQRISAFEKRCLGPSAPGTSQRVTDGNHIPPLFPWGAACPPAGHG